MEIYYRVSGSFTSLFPFTSPATKDDVILIIRNKISITSLKQQNWGLMMVRSRNFSNCAGTFLYQSVRGRVYEIIFSLMLHRKLAQKMLFRKMENWFFRVLIWKTKRSNISENKKTFKNSYCYLKYDSMSMFHGRRFPWLRGNRAVTRFFLKNVPENSMKSKPSFINGVSFESYGWVIQILASWKGSIQRKA